MFRWIADYFKERMMALDHEGVTTLLAMVNLDMASYPGAKRAATLMSDGAP